MIETANDLKEIYLAIGVGGMSFITVISILVFMLKSILPALETIKEAIGSMTENSSVTTEVLKNNTKAIEELAKSNDNVATALELLKHSTENVEMGIGKVQQLDEDINKQLIVLNERLR